MRISEKFKIWKFEKDRLETFSDAVFAIIMTILVLEIRLDTKEVEQFHIETSEDLWIYLKTLFPLIKSWLISFIILGFYWRNHHCIFKMSTKCDYALAWMNILFLMIISFIPFPCHLMGRYPEIPAAVALFGIVIMLSSFVMACMYYYIVKNYLSDLFDKKKAMKNVRKAFLAVPLIYGILTALAWYFPNLAFVFYLIIPVFFLLPLDKPKTQISTHKL